MALHKLETVELPAKDAPTAAWDAYFAGLKEPSLTDPQSDWEDYFRLEEEAAEAAPEDYKSDHSPVADPNLMGVGSKASTKR